jgi:hypothetical protein
MPVVTRSQSKKAEQCVTQQSVTEPCVDEQSVSSISINDFIDRMNEIAYDVESYKKIAALTSDNIIKKKIRFMKYTKFVQMYKFINKHLLAVLSYNGFIAILCKQNANYISQLFENELGEDNRFASLGRKRNEVSIIRDLINEILKCEEMLSKENYESFVFNNIHVLDKLELLKYQFC